MRTAILAFSGILAFQRGAESESMRTYGDDVAFLRQHEEVIELSDASGRARVAVVAQYQGRVMTSTSGGTGGPSFGWLNRSAIASKERKPHINVFGGEDRFWLGPEGGQYSIFFAPGDPFDLAHWQTPEPIDWGAWEEVERSAKAVRFRKDIQLVNYAGTKLSLEATRVIRMVDPPGGAGVESVAYESENTIRNTGQNRWTKESGLLSIWILGMFPPSSRMVVALPFVRGPETGRGPIVNDAYFGKVPGDRLLVKDGILYFRGDGKHRGKIGISRKRAMPVMGSYDADGRVLTLVEYTLPKDAHDYVNSMWEISDQPYGGDVVNSYNDGPPEPGKPPLGPFYELESSSPAAALAPGESLTHVHRTLHFRGSESELDPIARKSLGVSIADIRSAFP
jgi:hypothetical protein